MTVRYVMHGLLCQTLPVNRIAIRLKTVTYKAFIDQEFVNGRPPDGFAVRTMSAHTAVDCACATEYIPHRVKQREYVDFLDLRVHSSVLCVS